MYQFLHHSYLILLLILQPLANSIYDDAIEMLEFWNDKKQIAEFIEILDSEKHKNNPLNISDLAIKGSDLLPLCAKDFSKVGKTLEFLLEKVIENPSLNTKEKLIEIAEKELR